MPLDVLGCTRNTLGGAAGIMRRRKKPPPPGPRGLGNPGSPARDWDRWLQLFVLNEECLVSARQQRALNTSLSFVHTARRSYRSSAPVRPLDPAGSGQPCAGGAALRACT